MLLLRTPQLRARDPWLSATSTKTFPYPTSNATIEIAEPLLNIVRRVGGGYSECALAGEARLAVLASSLRCVGLCVCG